MATGAPGTNGVWQYGEDDSEATFSALLNKVASTTDTQIGTDRGRLTTLEARPVSGLVPIVPTAVDKSGGTATANTLGQVTFSGVVYVNVRGVFSAAYKNYRVVMTADVTTTAGLYVRASNAGTIDSSNVYNYEASYVTGTSSPSNWSNGASSTSALSLITTQTVAGSSTIVTDVLSPYIATRTVFPYTATGWNGNYGMSSGAGFYTPSTAHDGIVLGCSSGTISGTISVYGYND